MKKLVLFSVAMLFAGFGTQSCIDNNVEPDPMAPGIDIYAKARSQYNCAVDGANIAFRLNILLSEADKQYDGSELTLRNLMVGDGENLFSKLFASGTVIAPETYDGTVENEYTITYNYNGETITIDNRRKGGVIVSTNGVLLSNLPFDTGWSIRVDPNNPVQPYMGYDNVSASDVYATVDFGDYYIVHRGGNQFEVQINGYTSYIADAVKSDWTSNMMVGTNFSAWDYETVTGSEVTVHGESYGDTMYWTATGVQLEMSYDIPSTNPMVFTPGSACGWSFFKSATEIARIENHSEVDLASYPSAQVTVETTSSGNCVLSQRVSYNGQIRVY